MPRKMQLTKATEQNHIKVLLHPLHLSFIQLHEFCAKRTEKVYRKKAL